VTDTLLAVSDVTIQRGIRQLLQGVDLVVRSGEIWQLRGSNGVGKTSLLRAMAGLARVEVFGSITRCDDVLYSGHAAALKSALSARDNLISHPSGSGSPAPSEIDAALARVQLEGYEHVNTGQLSAGQKRRVALARLFLPSGRLWLLDEPFTALDSHGVKVLETRFVEHVAQGGAVVFTSHQPANLGDKLQVVDLEQFNGE
jgi:heme exporter protein A